MTEDCGIPPGSSPLVGVATDLFRFFCETVRLRSKEITSTDQYEPNGKVIWLADLPQHSAAHSALEDDEVAFDDEVMVVEKVPKVDPPILPQNVRPWLGEFDHRNAGSNPELLDERLEPISDGGDDGHGEDDEGGPGVEILRLSDFPDVEPAYTQWRPRWMAWAAEERRNRPVRALYEELYRIESQTSVLPEEWDLVVATGLLSVRRPGYGDNPDIVVKRHVFTYQAIVEMDEQTGSLHVSLNRSLDPFRLELDMLPTPQWPDIERQQELQDLYQTKLDHPLDIAGVDGLLGLVANAIRTPDATSLAQELHPPDSEQVSDVIVLRSAPALILRARPRAPKLAFFNRIADQLEQLERDGRELPAGLLHLVDPDVDPSAVDQSEPTAARSEPWQTADETFLPLEANATQLRIVHHVEHHPFTVVQGPPGTGKTHTIANILGHLLASGQRVLITAEKDQALREVRDKLPHEIQQLCVSAVGRDDRDRKQLEVAARTLQDRRGGYEADEYARERSELESTIESQLRKKAQLNAELVEARKWEIDSFTIAGYEGTPGQIAQNLADDRSPFEWFEEFLSGPREQCPSNSDAIEYLSYVRDDELEELAGQLDRRLPDDWEAQLLAPNTFGEQLHHLSEAKKAADEVADLRSDPTYQALRDHTRYHRTEVATQARSIADHLQRREESTSGWLAGAHDDVIAGRIQQWERRASDLERLIDQADEHIQAMGIIRVNCKEGQEPLRFKEIAENLLKHLKGGGKLREWFRAPPVVRQAAEFMKFVQVDHSPPQTVASIEGFLNWLDARRLLDAVLKRWPRGVEPRESDTLNGLLDWHRDELSFLRNLLDERRAISAFRDQLERLVLPIPDFSVSATVRHYVEVTEALERFEALHEAEHPLGELVANLQRELNFGDSADAVGELLAGAELHDSARYRTAYQALSVLSDAQQRNARRSELRAEFEVVAPGLCAAIDGDPNPTWDVRLERLTEARNWCEARAWITQSPHDAQGLQRQLERVREKIKEDRGALISNRAWDLALGRLSQRDTASLGSYVLAVGTLGRGTGKYAASRRRDVQERLKACRGAVAAWIMPLHRVFSDMRPEAEMFDIVIVDEASQAGTEANFLHYLAPRVLVIGDDKQVAPEAPGLDLSQIHALVDNYLGEIPEDQRLVFKNPAISYFDHAKIRTDTITLTEHFRCVPEIIEFSNREFYRPAGIELTPVRQYGTDRLRPLKSHFVSDGYRQGKRNQPEAEALVEELCRCVEDPAYTREGSDGEPEPLTMGVISLTDRHQAEAISNMLLDRLPEGELRARQIRCGTAADFQGSERDVIFLSMVNSMTGVTEDGSGEIRYMPLTRARAERRYNVACSRAKDQMWLFHSLQIAELSNTEDLRLRLLSFYDNQTFDPVTGESLLVPEDEKVPPFDSKFEQRVYNEIVRKGYRVVPQFKVYGRKIDLVIEGATSRLAVECDGDHWHGEDQYQQDTERQRDLERVGWKFFRVRESEFNYDRDQALEQLWNDLDKQGIHSVPAPPSSPPGGAPSPPSSPPGGAPSPGSFVEEMDPAQDLSTGRTDESLRVSSSEQDALTESGLLRAQVQKLVAQLEELRADTGSSGFEEDQEVREEIEQALNGLRSIRQGVTPCQFTLGPVFAISLEQLGGRYRKPAIRTCAEVISGVPKLLTKRSDHPLRTGNKQTALSRVRDDGAEARRCYLEKHGPGARRLHYWKLPDGSIELAVVTVHEDMGIPSS